MNKKLTVHLIKLSATAKFSEGSNKLKIFAPILISLLVFRSLWKTHTVTKQDRQATDQNHTDIANCLQSIITQVTQPTTSKYHFYLFLSLLEN